METLDDWVPWVGCLSAWARIAFSIGGATRLGGLVRLVGPFSIDLGEAGLATVPFGGHLSGDYRATTFSSFLGDGLEVYSRKIATVKASYLRNLRLHCAPLRGCFPFSGDRGGHVGHRYRHHHHHNCWRVRSHSGVSQGLRHHTPPASKRPNTSFPESRPLRVARSIGRSPSLSWARTSAPAFSNASTTSASRNRLAW